MNDPMIPMIFEVSKNRRETLDVRTIELTPKNGDQLRFLPGQFMMIWSFGVGEAPISISGDPAVQGRLVHTIRRVGAVTTSLCGKNPHETVGIRGPYGTGWPVEEGENRDVVIIAGGIGLAPLRPAIYSILGQRARYRRVSLLYGTRRPADILFRREIEKLRQRLDLDVHITVDGASREWRGSVGPVTTLIPRAAADPTEALALVCGPEIMMRFTAQALMERGFNRDRIWLSLERNMKCGVGLCGHCQYGPKFICRDGPVLPYPEVERFLRIRGL